jgi:predicted acyl esterase
VLAPAAGGEDGSFTDLSTSSEERALKEGLEREDGWLYYASAPLAAPLRIVGSPVLDVLVTDSQATGQLSPTLVDVAPDGTAVAISRGHLNLQYREGLEKAVPVPAGRPVRARVRLAPQDQTIPAGHRIGLIVAGSNVVWALPDQPGATYGVASGVSQLTLPVSG